MNKVLSYYKRYILTIFFLGAIIFAMVRFELLLPKYTSNIVNIGIQQDGLTDEVPRVLDEKNYAMILSLSDKEDKKVIASSYELWNPNSKKDKDKKIKEENSYVEMIPMSKYKGSYYILKEDIDVNSIEKNISNALLNYGKYIASRTETKGMDNMNLTSNLSKLPDSVKKQIGIKIVGELYKFIGIDVDSIQKQYLWKTGGLMLIMSLISGGLSISVSLISSRLSSKVARELRQDVFRKVMTFSSREMDKFSIASLITKNTNDIQQIQQSSVILMRFLFYAPFMAIGALLNVFTLDVSMVWIIALSVFVTLVSIALIMTKALPKFKLTQTIVDKLNLVTREFISGIEVNRVFRTEKFEEERFDSVNKELTGINLFTTRLMSLLQPMMMLVMNCAALMVIWFGSKQISLGVIQVGDMMAFLEYTMQIIMAFLFISMVSVILPRAMISANRISEVLKTESSIKDSAKTEGIGKVNTLEFRNVSFRYGEKSEDVIKNISFKVNKGETVGIIGSTGSGKSTIVNLIPRFIDATEGEILINGINIRDISINELRNRITVIPQKPVIFSGTIATNIEYAQSIKNNKRMLIASEIAQCNDFINEKENGYDNEVSQSGSNLSGGQKQRISIARSLTRDAEIMVFDDSFSALDSKTDKNLRRELKKNLHDEIVLIVSQRINTIMDANNIIVLENGEIVGVGTHEELVKSCDIYYEIAKSQLSEEVLENGK